MQSWIAPAFAFLKPANGRVKALRRSRSDPIQHTGRSWMPGLYQRAGAFPDLTCAPGWPTMGPRRVAIIGGGVVGCATALELQQRGFQVTVLDRNGEVGHGSTSASCGFVRRFYSHPGMYFRPEGSERDLIVGTMDPPCDELEWVDPDDYNEGITETYAE